MTSDSNTAWQKSPTDNPSHLERGLEHAKTRWHLNLHPDVVRESAGDPFPKFFGHFFHPTYATLTHKARGQQQMWTSRDHRKHRHIDVSPHNNTPRFGDSFWKRLAHMGRLEYWNVSWWVAQAFTWGSVVWVVNGFASFLPFCNSHFQTASTSTGWTAFLGATIFEIGSIFGILEAWNRDDTENFGWNVEHAFHHDPKKVIIGKHGPIGTPTDDNLEVQPLEVKHTKPEKTWIWFSADPRYWRELGFLAAFWQLFGATVFWISGFTAIPTIQKAIENNIPLLNGVFWAPQVIGGSGFIISSTFIMLESQKRWYKPQPLSLGWQVGVWNFIGGIGFTLCGALGFAQSSSGAKYESALATFWGSWGFLIGSVVQWYESVNSV
ncbi:hypothetical protein B0H34DRAFT_675223 [Crassisporium funariophilum]|nr:hypothetical protein B0H34DRAFT_675223 [Crassisporium funariophilum]